MPATLRELCYSPSDYYYAALLVLLYQRQVSGEVRRCDKQQRVVENWHVECLSIARRCGLMAVTPAVSELKRVRKSMCKRVSLLVVPAGVCCLIENPWGFMEKQRYLAVHRELILNVDCCAYGAWWKKPAVLWVTGFDFEGGLCLGKACPAVRAGRHFHHIGQDQGHTLVSKVTLPGNLIDELLRAMMLNRPGGKWLLYLFESVGSWVPGCRSYGITHVGVSYEGLSVIDKEGHHVHLRYDLCGFSLKAVLDDVYHYSGLHPGSSFSFPL